MTTIPPEIKEAIKWFRQIYLNGIPVLLRQNETSFLSFLSVVAATDALAGYRYKNLKVGDRFTQFVTNYFPSAYSTHAANLYLFRCRLLHNFSPAYFSLIHASPQSHLQPSPIGDTILSDEPFFSDMRAAAERYFAELQSDAQLQADMLDRLQNLDKGGAISVREI
jgi:hypothetical protein